MQRVFPKSQYRYYSMAVVERYDRPCFFMQLKATDTSPVNLNVRNMYGTLYIDYFPATVNESEMLEVVEKLQEVFGLAVMVGSRAVYIEGMEWDFIGQERNHLQITVDVLWKVRIRHTVEEPLMRAAEIKTKMEE